MTSFTTKQEFDGQKIYVPTTLASYAARRKFFDKHYRGRKTKNVLVRISTGDEKGDELHITVPAEASDNEAYSEVYRNNYKPYRK